MIFDMTPSQKQRLRELGRVPDEGAAFSTAEDRDAAFIKEVAYYQSYNRNVVRDALDAPKRHPLSHMEEVLAQALVDEGFLDVKTPTIISGDSIRKMGISCAHPLNKQIFWVDGTRCLRPMLAPNLYFLMRHLKRNAQLPLRLFEIGPCYRIETHGSDHLEEFTMLNLVELAPQGDPLAQLHHHIATVMGAVGLDYQLCECDSEVYSRTIDVEVDGSEVASAALGPHALDRAHGIEDPWVGVGFGLERLLMSKSAESNIRKVGRSLIYLQGARIDV
ncbi:pyrrolysine--tRNA(Pyl) ligase large subunit [Methanomassiliicoccus luminyensis]|uniref:pyrrolysine--tRNA(Pyl) ligase large subunit n=1 Tax=Methanomassiliicoccus luminyensis TaxID=1080712 RepID=UPI0003686606|nr:pyrrolysine--tRNA(Pyl) ligase large subunit [Methanomassiliicoccus luminyensis]